MASLLSTLVLTCGIACSALALAHPAQAADPADELVALGWTRDAAPPACELVQPMLEAHAAVWLALHEPGLPLPSLRCLEGEVVLPVLADPGLLARQEGSPPTVTWTLRAEGRLRGNAGAVALDFPPFAPPEAVRGAITSPFPPEFGKPLAIAPKLARDPALHGRASRYNRVPEPLSRPIEALIEARILDAGVAADGLLATADGKRWLALELGGDQPQQRFALGPERVFIGEGRIFVAPRALQLQSETTILAVDTISGSVTSLGRPAPPDAGRWLRVTDVRERGGIVEALVAVEQLGQDGITSPYGLLARRVGTSWTFPERYFTPAAPGVLPELRFDGADSARVRLISGDIGASRLLNSAPPTGTAAAP